MKNFKKNTKPTKNTSLGKKILIILGIFLLILTSLPIVIILLIGLLPTLTILLTDPKNTQKMIIIGSFNLAGVFIYLINILNNYSVRDAFFVFSDIFNLIIMLGSAALGLIIYIELPNLVIWIYKATSQKRLEGIEARLQKLASDWGQETINKIADRNITN